MDEELEEIERRKIEKYKRDIERKLAEAYQKQQMEAMKKALLWKFLTSEAMERLSRVRFAHPEIAEQVEFAIIQAAQTGQLKKKIDDQELKQILKEVSSSKRSFRIIK
ncbi:MAG: DNA-binding protein [Candidatus Parvarchaeota archaeon]|nr:DNA-binding protein [Candidatus Jingweiarchaeum tengchongense]MCW1298223.1 DNA-binding protein [Candidatus Jingweiarchaeum tengchongense]MCW1300021.1 DNA-binding protein [Candidatus Jingweiarchaeum tengchongense]MCW1304840.1 DNA-binding protein [Candidatus Jingweiarchaeum tengchongense]MCW1305430.1 DNA-binding protein [Candidatus Jingweiarchaeum tengchongense]